MTRITGGMGVPTTKKDDGFTKRALMVLVTAMADQNYRDADAHGYNAKAIFEEARGR